MKKEEKIEEYFSSVQAITNQMKLCGETLFDKSVMEKILKTLPSQFDHLVITIEETKDLNEVKIEELQRALEAHEMKITGRKEEKDEEQVLLARLKQEESKKEFWKKKKRKNQYKDKQKHGDKPESSKSGGEGRNLIRRRYNALIVISMDIMLLNVGPIKVERERTRSKKQMLLRKIPILILIQSC